MAGSRRSGRSGKAEFATRRRPFAKEGDNLWRSSSCCLEERAVTRCAIESDFVMGCPRCHNLMVEETFVDQKASLTVSSFTGWRCPICGEILDPIILQNRTRHPEPQDQRVGW